MTNIRKYMNLLESSSLPEDNLEQTHNNAVDLLHSEIDSTIEEAETDTPNITIDDIKKLIASGRLELYISVEKDYGSYGSGEGVRGVAKLYFDESLVSQEDDFTSVASLDSSYNDYD